MFVEERLATSQATPLAAAAPPDLHLRRQSHRLEYLAKPPQLT
jgi:hypothetical protein